MVVNRNSSQLKLNRRQLFRAGAAGACMLCLYTATGCSPEEEAVDDESPLTEESGIHTGKKGLIKTRRSPWYTELSNNRVRCELCPRQCELEEGERAPCRVRENRDGSCYTLVYGNPALVQEDPIERKPFFHVKPGSRALSISTAGCNLACKFCEVWDMALVKPEEVYAYEFPPAKILNQAQAGAVSALSFAFGEPVIYYEYMDTIAEKAKNAGMLNLMHTAAYIQEEPLRKIIEKMDAINVDLKGFTEEFYRDYVGGDLNKVLENLKLIRESNIHLEITNIVIPTLNDDTAKIKEMCEWIRDELGEDVPLHFARFYPLYQLSALPRTPVSTMENARNTALEAGLKYVYLSRVTGHEGENTFCPNCGEKLIDRKGFVVEEQNIEDNGQCAFCGFQLPGHWK